MGRFRMSDSGEIESALGAVPRMAGGGKSRRREPGRRALIRRPCRVAPAVRPGRPGRGIHGPAPGTEAPDQEASGLQEQAESLLPPLRQAIEHFRSVTPKEEQAAWSAGKPIAEALATLDEALDRCRVEIEKARLSRSNKLRRKLVEFSTGARGLCPGCAASSCASITGRCGKSSKHEARGMNQDWLQSLLEGFDLIHNRVRRVLKSEAIEPIVCLGLPVDPERMIVIETTDSTDWPPQTVVDELRRGYTWKGRVLRLAEVRAVRGRRVEDHEEPDDEEELAELEGFAGEEELADEEDSAPNGALHEPSADNGSRSAWLETE